MYDKELNPPWRVEIAFDEDETHTHATLHVNRCGGRRLTAQPSVSSRIAQSTYHPYR